MKPFLPDLVGLTELAERLGVNPRTPQRWRDRGVLPPPRWLIGGTPVWDWNLDVVPWAEDTGRLPENAVGIARQVGRKQTTPKEA